MPRTIELPESTLPSGPGNYRAYQANCQLLDQDLIQFAHIFGTRVDHHYANACLPSYATARVDEHTVLYMMILTLLLFRLTSNAPKGVVHWCPTPLHTHASLFPMNCDTNSDRAVVIRACYLGSTEHSDSQGLSQSLAHWTDSSSKRLLINKGRTHLGCSLARLFRS